MATKKRVGIPAAHEWVLQGMTRVELVQGMVDAAIEHAKEKRTRNRAGALARGKKTIPHRKIATEVHAALKSKFGRNPKIKEFRLELKARYPDVTWPVQKHKTEQPPVDLGWDRDVVEEWWKKLNKGENI